jgi:flavin-dependent dehydrogenase
LSNTTADIIIIGGGLAGLVSSIHLSRTGLNVVLIEKDKYPKHKVCGEYISNEVLPYLQNLDADPLAIGAKKINRFLLSTTHGKTTETKLPLGGIGISRYTLDNFLFEKAVQCNCSTIQDAVTDVQFANDLFRVITKEGKEITARIVIGAFGKRSNMDIRLNRAFIKNKSPFIAVKTYLKGDFPEDMVALHNFKGGYCGVSQVETGDLNVCFFTNYENFRLYKNIDAFRKEVMCKNIHLKNLFENTTPVFEQPLAISQISFSNKSLVDQHIIMCGDAAGMIHPLCGNGMAIAIHSGKIASELVIDFFNGKIKSRQDLEITYSRQWEKEFKRRIATGRILQTFFGKDNLAQIIMYGLTHIPGILPAIIRKTHGRVLNVSVV